MRTRIFPAALLCIFICAMHLFAQDPSGPLSQIQLIEALKAGGLSHDDLAAIVRRRGINFEMSVALEQKFREDGANTGILIALWDMEQWSPPKGEPLSKDFLVVLLQSGMPPQRLTKWIVARKIKFELTSATEKELQSAGASDQVLALAATNNVNGGVEAAQKQSPVQSPTEKTTGTPNSQSTRSVEIPLGVSAGYLIEKTPELPRGAAAKMVLFSLRYQDISIGTGTEAEPLKTYRVIYTGYRAADGVKVDSSSDHRSPILGPDGKPEMGADGKPKLGDPQPFSFPQGMGRLIPGFDQGFAGMRAGGKRRLFIPWQLAYGVRGIPDRPGHPGIPPKSDMIFDVELVDVSETPPQKQTAK
jgi:peptidylprolyl isomerase